MKNAEKNKKFNIISTLQKIIEMGKNTEKNPAGIE